MDIRTGEIEIVLNGVTHTMKATWRAVAAVEHALGYGIVPLTQRILAKNFGQMEAAIIIYHGLKEAGAKGQIDLDKVQEQIYKTGILNKSIVDAITLFCEYALTGGQEPGKQDAAEKKEQEQKKSQSVA